MVRVRVRGIVHLDERYEVEVQVGLVLGCRVRVRARVKGQG